MTVLSSCAFETNRLMAAEWHTASLEDPEGRSLAEVVSAMLTEPVTHSLPASWRGAYSPARAGDWIRERDDEGCTLLAVEKATGQAVGLVMLFESQLPEAGGTELRIGYLLAEPYWGKGLASELVAGLVTWCRESAEISSLAGGVESDNPASRRVLEKNGFSLDESEANGDEQLFRLRLC